MPTEAELLAQIEALTGAIVQERLSNQRGGYRGRGSRRPYRPPRGRGQPISRASRNMTLVNTSSPASDTNPQAASTYVSRGNKLLRVAPPSDGSSPDLSLPKSDSFWSRPHPYLPTTSKPRHTRGWLATRSSTRARGGRWSRGRVRSMPGRNLTLNLRMNRGGDRPHEIVIAGNRYLSDARGNKLVRVSSSGDLPPTLPKPIGSALVIKSPSRRRHQLTSTPKLIEIGGVAYIRTQRGNLVRSSLVRRIKHAPSTKRKPCRNFAKYQYCKKGKHCRFDHTTMTSKVLCTQYGTKDGCPRGDKCPFSHTPTPENTSLCVLYQRHGQCRHGEACRFAHYTTSPSAPVCRDFALKGWCDRGYNCPAKHFRICAAFARTGSCMDPRCQFPHVARQRGGTRTGADSTAVDLTLGDSASAAGSWGTKAPASVPAPVSSSGTPSEEGDLVEGNSDYIPLLFESDEEEEEIIEDNDDQDASEGSDVDSEADLTSDSDSEEEEDDVDGDAVMEGSESDGRGNRRSNVPSPRPSHSFHPHPAPIQQIITIDSDDDQENPTMDEQSICASDLGPDVVIID